MTPWTSLTEKLRAVIHFPLDEHNLTTKVIIQDLAKEAFEAEHSRDRREAFHLLGKSKGMFRDVVEVKCLRPAEQFLDDIEKHFGRRARALAAEELGLECE